VNAVLFALYNLAFTKPSLEAFRALPDTDPMTVLKMAQEFIDSEKRDSN
jgi:hypothetical protein